MGALRVPLSAAAGASVSAVSRAGRAGRGFSPAGGGGLFVLVSAGAGRWSAPCPGPVVPVGGFGPVGSVRRVMTSGRRLAGAHVGGELCAPLYVGRGAASCVVRVDWACRRGPSTPGVSGVCCPAGPRPRWARLRWPCPLPDDAWRVVPWRTRRQRPSFPSAGQPAATARGGTVRIPVPRTPSHRPPRGTASGASRAPRRRAENPVTRARAARYARDRSRAAPRPRRVPCRTRGAGPCVAAPQPSFPRQATR